MSAAAGGTGRVLIQVKGASRRSPTNECMNVQQDRAEFGRLPQPVRDALGLLPHAALGWIAAAAAAILLDGRPRLFERLGEHAGKRFAFVPLDLPFAFVVRPLAASPTVEVVQARPRPDADVVVAGPLVILLALLEGRLDGDATFFSRDIEVAGDIAALLAMRNAIDAAGIDLPRELAAHAGPLAWPLRAALEGVRAAVLPDGRGAAWN